MGYRYKSNAQLCATMGLTKQINTLAFHHKTLNDIKQAFNNEVTIVL